MGKVRNSNIELLRILSIIMIVVSHYCVHGVGINNISNMSLGLNRFLLEILVLGNLGSILFVLISGYYLSNSKKIKLKKIIRLIFQIGFYSVFIYLILAFLGIGKVAVKDFIKVLFPITFKEYWFATAYILIYIFHPYINKMLNSFSRKEHFMFICLMFFIFSILHTLTTSDYYGNELIQFLMFYCIGSYLYKYPNNFFERKNHNYKVFIVTLIIILLSIVCFDLIGKKISIINTHSIYLLSRTSPFAILLCCALFDFFSRRKIFENRFINSISSLIFGVYLISDNNSVRPLLWNDIFKNVDYINSSFLILHIITSIVTTIIVCLLLEAIRKHIIENTIFKFLDTKIDKIQEKIEIIINKKLKMS